MTDCKPRTFKSDAEIAHIGEGLLARTLSRPEWTHEAHLAATTYLLTCRARCRHRSGAGRAIIRSYNESVGGVNSDSEGYHETITLRVPPWRAAVSDGSRFAGRRSTSSSMRCCSAQWAGATGRFASIRASGCSASRRGLGFAPPDLAAFPD